MSQIWKTIPLFISSTFRDMHAERDQLNRVVFPAIEERLKPRRCRITPIDLRVGVETDSTQTERERELQILKVCLAEIERSRPFLLVLLGDRYGWVPGEDRIKTATGEAGFALDDHGGSVTALEIEYGLLKKDPVQRRRCLLCLREPLPYGEMPKDKAVIYSDAHATDPGAPDRVRRLKSLKARINADPELTDHRHPYMLDWDKNLQRPVAESIEVWGHQVEVKLWKLLDEETKAFAAQAEPTWEEQERFAIEEQVERLNGSFVGRKTLVKQALDLALSGLDVAQASSPAGSAGVSPAVPSSGGTAAPLSTGLVFTGGSGTGKSALFAHLHHQLSTLNPQPLLLSHAAGVSPKAGQTEWMLRRWIGELGAALSETPDMPENIKPEDLEKLFAQLLHRVAIQRRVVVLVDALNQFVRTDRTRTVSWLPTVWPDNARFIATTIPGEESTHLARRPVLTLVDVPPLDSSEAEAIAGQVYGRYHREPNADVLRAVLALRQSDGTSAAGNPLWFTLALDLLNLLDDDDFSAAEATVGGSPAEKLRRLLLNRASGLPPDMEGLYGRLLEQVEKVAGTAETRAFAALTALSRHGWREEDLLHLLPKAAELLAGSDSQPSTFNSQLRTWDSLRFAVLRRCFRAHLVKRGALEQWDFAHTSLRRAVLARLDGEWKGGRTESLPCALYACGADYLETLPPGTGVRGGEIMWQMLGTRRAARAARFYAHPTSSSKMLALFLIEDEATACYPLRQFVLTLVQPGAAPGVTEVKTQAEVANKFIFELNDALEIEGHLRLRKELLTSANDSLSHLVSTDLSNTGWQRDLSVSLNKLGEVLFYLGDLAGVHKAYQESQAEATRLASANPSNANWQRDLSVSLIKKGEVLFYHGDLAGALNTFQESLAVSTRMVSTDPHNAGWLQDLSVSQEKIGEVLHARGDLAGAFKAHQASLAIRHRLTKAFPSNTDWQRALSVSQNFVGDVLHARGDLAGALNAYQEALAVRERLVSKNPSNTGWQRDLSVSQSKVGDVLRARGDLSATLNAYLKSMAVSTRLASADLSNSYWQEDLCVSQSKVGEVLHARGDLAGALKAYQESMAVLTRLASVDPSNSYWQRNLSASQSRLGDVLCARGDLAGAFKAYQASLAVATRLATLDPSNSDWQENLSLSLSRVGDVLLARSDLAEAFKAYQASLAVATRLASTNPSNANLQRSLSLSHGKVGDVLLARGDLSGAFKASQESLAIQERLTFEVPSNAGWQQDIAASFQRLARIAVRAGDEVAGAKYFGKCHDTLKTMQASGMHLDETIASLLARLDQSSIQNYAPLIVATAHFAAAPAPSVPMVFIPDPLAQPRGEISLEELREAAERCFKKDQWEAAATHFEKLLQQQEPVDQVAPQLITCLLNAHETPMESDVKRVETLLQQLEQAGHADLVVPLRQQLQAKLPRKKKSWMFW